MPEGSAHLCSIHSCAQQLLHWHRRNSISSTHLATCSLRPAVQLVIQRRIIPQDIPVTTAVALHGPSCKTLLAQHQRTSNVTCQGNELMPAQVRLSGGSASQTPHLSETLAHAALWVRKPSSSTGHDRRHKQQSEGSCEALGTMPTLLLGDSTTR
jgi:hypothetical protein